MIARKKIFSAVALLSAGIAVSAHAASADGLMSSSAFGGEHQFRSSINLGTTLTPSLAVAGPVETSSSALPDAPSAVLSGSYIAPAMASYARPANIAPKYAVDIKPGQEAQPLDAHDKVIFGLRDAISPFSFVGYVVSAGYSHVTNGQPNYGTNSTAFGQRFGATVARDASETIFAESILAPVFHEDPRYYVMGDSHNFFARVIYSVTRPIITRTDHGHQTINASVLVGYAGGSALSYTYYPEINKNFKDTAATFGGSLAGAAVGDFVSEFLDDALGLFHHRRD